MLSALIPLSNSKVSLFSVDVVGYPTSSEVSVSEYIIYFGSVIQNFSYGLFDFVIRLLRRGELIFLCNMKNEISSLLFFKTSSILTCEYIPPASVETSDRKSQHLTFKC